MNIELIKGDLIVKNYKSVSFPFGWQFFAFFISGEIRNSNPSKFIFQHL